MTFLNNKNIFGKETLIHLYCIHGFIKCISHNENERENGKKAKGKMEKWKMEKEKEKEREKEKGKRNFFTRKKRDIFPSLHFLRFHVPPLRQALHNYTTIFLAKIKSLLKKFHMLSVK